SHGGDGREVVYGAMLVFDDHVVQLRGSRRGIRFLLENLKSGRIEVQVPADCEGLLLRSS
ncbi:MAG TPA: hypothetical protein VLU38_02865, partial [Methanomassiliicoccales archaeon]|nr:hypothetical protein [Methanomassiliicoccales archaeon]